MARSYLATSTLALLPIFLEVSPLFLEDFHYLRGRHFGPLPTSLWPRPIPLWSPFAQLLTDTHQHHLVVIVTAGEGVLFTGFPLLWPLLGHFPALVMLTTLVASPHRGWHFGTTSVIAMAVITAGYITSLDGIFFIFQPFSSQSLAGHYRPSPKHIPYAMTNILRPASPTMTLTTPINWTAIPPLHNLFLPKWWLDSIDHHLHHTPHLPLCQTWSATTLVVLLSTSFSHRQWWPRWPICLCLRLCSCYLVHARILVQLFDSANWVPSNSSRSSTWLTSPHLTW